MPGTHGNWARVWFNGYELTNDSTNLQYTHAFRDNPIMPYNVGVRQHTPGILEPTMSLQGYVRQGIGSVSAHNLFKQSGAGSTNDLTLIGLAALGVNSAPVAGTTFLNSADCVMYYGTRDSYARDDSVPGVMGFNVALKPRGQRLPLFPQLIYVNDAFKTATSVTSGPYDDGAEGTSTSQGLIGMVQIYSPTGVASSGNITVATQPVAADTLTINGTVYTWRAALTPTANEVLIGATALASAQNLYKALVGDPTVSGTAYAAGTTSWDQTLSNATVFFGQPSGGSNTITITYATTGTAGNSFTLAKSGTGGVAVSGATLAGGTAGDTYNVTIGSAASSGGSYTTHLTFSGVGATRSGYVQELNTGTPVLEWIKATVTLASGAGTSQTCGIAIAMGRIFQL